MQVGQQCLIPLLVGTLLLVKVTKEEDSICSSMQYRELSAQLQNEHQCMILEKLQQDFEMDKTERDGKMIQLLSIVNRLQSRLVQGFRRGFDKNPQKSRSPALKGIPLVRDCNELYRNGVTKSGVYPIQFENILLNVWCDMNTDHGGWTTIQRREDGSLNFTKYWDDYAFGFGNVNSEFWLGNENMHQLTKFQNYSLRVDIWDWDNNTAYAMYDYFWLTSESDHYRLHLSDYNGTAGDALAEYHNEMRFSTPERDNDKWYGNCAKKDGSGWWFRACSFSSLNGVYVVNGTVALGPERLIQGIIWYNWRKDYGYSMKRTEMKIKPRAAVLLQREKELIQKAAEPTKTSNKEEEEFDETVVGVTIQDGESDNSETENGDTSENSDTTGSEESEEDSETDNISSFPIQ